MYFEAVRCAPCASPRGVRWDPYGYPPLMMAVFVLVRLLLAAAWPILYLSLSAPFLSPRLFVLASPLMIQRRSIGFARIWWWDLFPSLCLTCPGEYLLLFSNGWVPNDRIRPGRFIAINDGYSSFLLFYLFALMMPISIATKYAYIVVIRPRFDRTNFVCHFFFFLQKIISFHSIYF